MLVRTMLVAVTTAALLPLTGGAAHASCLDDALATNLFEGYSESPKSEQWGSSGFLHSHIDQAGPATFTVHGDALASDSVSWVTVDWPVLVQTVATNSVGATTEFADCVAG